MRNVKKCSLFLKTLSEYRYVCEYIHVYKSIFCYYNLGMIGPN